ncbi:MAG: anthranilate phosphoribosyltransferase [Phycisphaerae bacterium]|jgi:anthranilate phosphoribosyltransferase
MADNTYSDLLRRLLAGESLSREQSHWAFSQIMDGQWTTAQVAGLLVGLAAKGETSDEIAGAASAMREHVVPIDTGGADVIDTCGTGGTGLATFNISTAAAMVCAGAGVKVAKHGNRTHTRTSGSADVLAALGVNIDAAPEVASACLARAGVCFCFAVRCHPAMKHAMPVRRELAVRTIFNLLGPLTNPAGARRQMMGIFRADLTETIAKVLASLGALHAMVMHAEDGLDEFSTTCGTKVTELRGPSISTRTVHPHDFGLPTARMADLLVSSPQQSAEVIRGVLAGKKGPARDIVVLNAAAAIAVADRVESIAAAIPLAQEAIDSAAAAAALDKLIGVSNGRG